MNVKNAAQALIALSKLPEAKLREKIELELMKDGPLENTILKILKDSGKISNERVPVLNNNAKNIGKKRKLSEVDDVNSKSSSNKKKGKEKTKFLEFEKARKIVRLLKLRGARSWWVWSKLFRPSIIPSTPDVTYKDSGWKGMADWLGTETLSTKENNKNFLPFQEARAIVRKQNLNGKHCWRKWSRLERPSNIPSTPNRTYANKGWKGMADWLGVEARKTRKNKKNFLRFEDAKNYVQKFNLKSKREWDFWSKTDRPDFIPSTPQVTYKKNKEWKGIPDFLGYKSKKTRY